jgi:hypothetical protein
VLLNPFCPFSTAKVLALKTTVLLLLTLLIKAISGGVVLAAGGAPGFRKDVTPLISTSGGLRT